MQYRLVNGSLNDVFLEALLTGKHCHTVSEKNGNLRAFSVGQERWMRWDYALPGIAWPGEEAIALEVMNGFCSRMAEAFALNEVPKTLGSLKTSLALKFWAKSGTRERVWWPASKVVGGVRRICAREEHIRWGAFGGRSELIRWAGVGKLTLFDLTSAYPTEALFDVPVSRPKRLDVESPANAGAYYYLADVEQPAAHFGALPFKMQDRPFFPVGSFRGWWWGEELERAEKLGAKVTRLRCYGFETKPLLRPLFGKLIGLRQTLTDFEKPVKLIANQLIGTMYAQNVKKQWKTNVPLEKLGRGWKRPNPDLPIDYQEIHGDQHHPWYSPVVYSFLMMRARIRVFDAMLATDPYVVHIDGLVSDGELDQEGWREKFTIEKGAICAFNPTLYRIDPVDTDGNREREKGITKGLWAGWDYGQEREADNERSFFLHANGKTQRTDRAPEMQPPSSIWGRVLDGLDSRPVCVERGAPTSRQDALAVCSRPDAFLS